MGTRWLVPALCAASVLLASGCGSDSSGTSDTPPPDGDVLVQNDRFDPSTLTVAAGTNVTWAWDSDGQEHTVTFDTDPPITSGVRTSGTFEHTFPDAGDFPYHCEIHPTTMKGTVTVTAAGGSAGGNPPGGGTGGGGGGGSYGAGATP